MQDIYKINITDSSGSEDYLIQDKYAQSELISEITLDNGLVSLTKTNNTVDIPAASSSQTGVATSSQIKLLDRVANKFKLFQIKGTTDSYGKISWPDSNYYPITALSRNFAITGDQNGLRVMNVQASDVILATKKSVDFYVIGMQFNYS